MSRPLQRQAACGNRRPQARRAVAVSALAVSALWPLPLAGLALLAGCAAPLPAAGPVLPPRAGYGVTVPPGAPAPDLAQGGAQRIVADDAVTTEAAAIERLSLGNAALAGLMRRALARNPTLEAADAALREAQALARAQRATLFPAVNASYAYSRTRQANAIPSSSTATPASPAGSVYGFHTAQLDIAYTLDVFGGLRRQAESAEAAAAVQREQWRAARLTVAAGVAGAVVQDALMRETLRLQRELIEDAEASLAVLERQREAGWASRLDVAIQENVLAGLRAPVPPLQRQLGQNGDALRALLGAAPDEVLELPTLDALQLPPTLPLAAPSRLVEQRPDVRAAEAALRAAAAQVGVARAARLPQFSVTAAMGGGAGRVADLFGPGGRFADVVLGLAQPVFDAGALAQREAAARAGHEQAAAQYRAAAIGALQNVADALHALAADAETLRLAVAGEAAARQALALVERQHRTGYLDRIALLNARQSARQAALGVVQARAARLADSLALVQATGGEAGPAGEGSATP